METDIKQEENMEQGDLFSDEYQESNLPQVSQPPDSTALTRMAHDSVLDPEGLRQQLAIEDQNWQILMEWIKKNLQEGVDYGYIEDTKKGWKSDKPSLFQPGAQKITMRLRFRPTFSKDAETYDMLALEGTVCYKCELIHRQTGEIWSEGRGVVEKDEKGLPANSRVKIAEKRAQVDAVIRLGLSEIFTQDLEDMGKPPDANGNGYSQSQSETKFSREYTLEFGKHKGKALKDVEDGYLEWLTQNAKEGFLKEFAAKELQVRKQQSSDSPPSGESQKYLISRTADGNLHHTTLKVIWGLASQYWGGEDYEKRCHQFVKYESIHNMSDEEVQTLIEGLDARMKSIRELMESKGLDVIVKENFSKNRMILDYQCQENYQKSLDALSRNEFNAFIQAIIDGTIPYLPF